MPGVSWAREGNGKLHLLTRLADHEGLALILAVTAAVEVAAAPIPIGVQQFLQLSQLVGILKERHSLCSAHSSTAYFIHSLFVSSLSKFSSCFLRYSQHDDCVRNKRVLCLRNVFWICRGSNRFLRLLIVFPTVFGACFCLARGCEGRGWVGAAAV